MKQLSWERFRELRGHEKRPFFERDGKVFHIVMTQQFDRSFLDRICELATKIRKMDDTHTGARFLKELLDNKVALLYFVQPSTRTYTSFNVSCQRLGMMISDITDPTVCSEAKGETHEDSVRTLSSYGDLVVMRHPREELAEKTAWMMNFIGRSVPIINAGSGRDQHPTQALLDVYTLHRSFENYGGIDGITIAMVGDLKRGRTVRSLSYLMQHYQDVKLIFVAPTQLQMRDDIKDYLREKEVAFEENDNLEEVVPIVDAVYMTRIQSEWDEEKGESARINYAKFQFRTEFLDIMKPNSVIVHPLPRGGEIPVEVDNDKRAMYWRQVRNGMWVRVALIATIFGKDQEILDF